MASEAKSRKRAAKASRQAGLGPNSSGRIVPWLFVLPPILWICTFSLFPFFNTIRLSFTDSTLLKPGTFVGLENYIDMFTDRRFQTAFFNSSLYVVCIVPFMVILPLMLASLVAEKTRIMNFFRTAFYTPVIMSSVVVGLLWTNILDKDGLLNGTFKALKWITTPIPFLTDRWLLLFSAMAVTIWSGLGYYMLIYLANIANIDSTLYEAASIDGCGGIRQFLHVTLPGCRMTMILVMLLSSMSAFRVFGEIYMLSGGSGGVGGADLTMTMLIKQEGTGINARTGYSGALGMVMFVVLGCIIVLIALLLFLAAPLLWQISLAFKGPKDDMYAAPYLIPVDPTIQNFVDVFNRLPLLFYVCNTLIVAALNIGGNIISGCFAGYSIALLKFKGKGLVVGLLFLSMLVPGETILISQFLIIRNLQLQNNLIGVALPGLVSSMNILLFMNAFKAIPREMIEAAEVDGANVWQRFWRVCVPQVKGTMALVGIFSFMGSWNDFLWPLIVLTDDSHYTLTLGMSRLQGTFVSDPRVVAAGTIIALVPIMIFFLVFQRYIFNGLEAGSVKE